MRYRAKRGQSVPMPDRPGQTMPDSGEGVALDPTNPYYARLIADGDLVEVEEKADEETPPPPPPATPATAKEPK